MGKKLLCLGVCVLCLVGAMSVNADLPKQEAKVFGNVTAEEWEGYTTDNLAPETPLSVTMLDTQDKKVIVADISLGLSVAPEAKQRYDRFGAWIMADVSVSDPDPSPVPEPATMLLLGAGLVVGTGFIRKNR